MNAAASNVAGMRVFERSKRTYLLSLIIALMLLSASFSSSLPRPALGQSAEANVFFDDFQSYHVGTFYPLGGWQFLGNPNIGLINITGLRSYAGTRSLLLNDSSVLRWFGFQAQSVGYEVAVYAAGSGDGNFGVMLANRLGFLNRNYQCGYCFWAGVDFLSPSMSIWVGDGNQVRVVGSWVPDVWYIVRVVLSCAHVHL